MTLTADTSLRAPFPWHGGKRRVALEVWGYLGQPGRYIEPFAGSLGVLLGRPGGAPSSGLEIVNDVDGYIVNVWRALKHDPDAAISWSDDVRAEYNLNARHLWLVNEGRARLTAGLQTDPEWYDAQVAGWWLYGVAMWIGDAFASGTGPWTSAAIHEASKLPHAGDDGQGVHRQLPYASGDGQGVHRQLPHAGNDGQGGSVFPGVYALARRLSDRLRRVLITNGDWERVLSDSVSRAASGITGIYLDPPYRSYQDTYAAGRDGDIEDLWQRIERYAATTPHRVVISGYAGDLDPPKGWRTIPYTASGTSSANRTNEVFWVSPNCLGSMSLFGEETA